MTAARREDLEALREKCEFWGYTDAVILIDVLLAVLHRHAERESKPAVNLDNRNDT